MTTFNRNAITKALSTGIMLMGMIHIAATFTPLIADKLALLPDSAQDAFTYFSLMCGTLLLLGGGLTFSLADKVAEYHFVRKPYVLAIAILTIAGILAACLMPHNPFAWGIFVLTMGLMLVNIIVLRGVL
ncbi:MAG: hypothetical protein MJY59_02240 [Bacteroidaceae bacterium]|nr:hypothetical protein [Bacteroidaceae bacterium]